MPLTEKNDIYDTELLYTLKMFILLRCWKHHLGCLVISVCIETFEKMEKDVRMRYQMQNCLLPGRMMDR